MSATAATAPTRVVATPEFLGRALFDPTCAEALGHWRDGRLRLVLNRELLVRYCRLLRSLGLGEEPLKRWVWWLTSPEKSEYHEHLQTGATTGAEICRALAKSLGVPLLRSDAWPQEADGLSAREWLAKMKEPGEELGNR